MLPGGYRSGNKWICGDLHDGKGKSCAVFLESGGFNDTNPSADYVKGSVIDLWKAILGVETISEVVEGMEAWVKDGSLPDGAQGVVRKNEVIFDEETIIARDQYEQKRIDDIHTYNTWMQPTPQANYYPTQEQIASYERKAYQCLS